MLPNKQTRKHLNFSGSLWNKTLKPELNYATLGMLLALFLQPLLKHELRTQQIFESILMKL